MSLTSLDKRKELEFIQAFIGGAFFDEEVCRDQLRSLWTAYCLHHGLDVDTAMYDAVLLDLFNALSLEQRRELCRNYYPKFDDVMGVWLA